jgi:hypothetical protein
VAKWGASPGENSKPTRQWYHLRINWMARQ